MRCKTNTLHWINACFACWKTANASKNIWTEIRKNTQTHRTKRAKVTTIYIYYEKFHCTLWVACFSLYFSIGKWINVQKTENNTKKKKNRMQEEMSGWVKIPNKSKEFRFIRCSVQCQIVVFLRNCTHTSRKSMRCYGKSVSNVSREYTHLLYYATSEPTSTATATAATAKSTRKKKEKTNSNVSVNLSKFQVNKRSTWCWHKVVPSTIKLIMALQIN